MRKLFALAALLVAVLPLYSQRIEGIGEGDTEQEARIAAQVALSSSIQSNLTYAIADQSLANSYGLAYDSTTMQALDYGQMKFINLQWEPVEKKRGTYYATCYIDEDQKDLYLDAYNSDVEAINSLSALVDSSATNQAKISTYRSLVDALTSYETSRQVLRILDPDLSLETPVRTSSLTAMNELNVLLESEMNSSRVQIDVYGQAIDFLDETDKARYDSQLATFAEYEELSRNINQQMQDRIVQSSLSNVESIRNAMVNQLRDIEEQDYNEVDEDSISYYVNQIESKKLLFFLYKDNLDDSLATIEADWQKAIVEAEKLAFGNYSKSELNSDGTVMASAKARRQELFEENKADITERYSEMATDLYVDGLKDLKDITKDTEKIISSMNKKKFKLNSDKDEVRFSINSFNPSSACFYGQAYVVIGSTSWTVDLVIPYENVIGEKFGAADDLYSYTAAMEAADNYLDLFNSVPGLFTLEAEFTVEGTVLAYEYAVNIKEYSIRDNSSGKIVAGSDVQQGTSVEIDSTNLTDYSVIHHSLIDEKKYEPYEEDFTVIEVRQLDNGGTEAVLSMGRMNGLERKLESGLSILLSTGGSAGTEKWGFHVGGNFVFPANIGDCYLFPALHLSLNIYYPWERVEKEGSVDLQLGLMFEKTLRKGFVQAVGFGAYASLPEKFDDVKLGAKLQVITGNFLEFGVSWETEYLSEGEFWKSSDVSFWVALSFCLDPDFP